MRKYLLFFALFLFNGLLVAQTADPNAVDGEVFFQLKSSAYAQAIQSGMNNLKSTAMISGLKSSYRVQNIDSPFKSLKDARLQRTFLMHFKNIYAVDSIIHDLKQNPNIAYAEKAPLFHILFTPNDPEYNSTDNHRWYLELIHAPEAWNLEKGDAKVKIAILDNGIYIDHPDLAGKFTDSIDLANGDSNPTPPAHTLDWSHGTHVSGLAGASTNNGIGIASLGYNVSLMAVKISNDTTDGRTMSYGYQGIIWAADHGANVISMSWGGSGYYQTGQNVVDYAYDKGCTLIAAAGNDGDSKILYPAGYKHVISVASVDYDDVKSNFSSYGSTVDISAPGGYNALGYSIFSTAYLNDNSYTYMQGTSMATPIVSALAGLMISADSTLTPEKLQAIMKATSDNIDAENPGYVGKLGAGRINAYKAIVAVQDSLSHHTVVANFQANILYIPEGETVSFTDKSYGTPTSWSWSFLGGTPNSSTAQNPVITYNVPGVYPVSLTVSDGTNSNTETKTAFITVYSLSQGAWEPQATGFSQASRGIDYISIVNQNVAWADAYDGSGVNQDILEFTRTSDGGYTWVPGTYVGIPSTYKVSSILATDYDTAWVSAYNTVSGTTYGGIFKTQDGGANWNQQTTASFSSPTSFPNFVYFWDGKNGICQGDPVNNYFEIYTTTDGGTTWNRIPSANIPVALSGEYGYVSLYAVYDNTIWFGTNKGRVFKSADRGQNWTVASTGMTEVSNLGFHDANTGIATYVTYDQNTGNISGFQMKKSTDGGASWTTVNPTGTYYKSDMAVIKNEPGLLISTGNSQDPAQCGSAYSLDDGQTWTQLDDSIQYTTVKFYNRNVGWAGGFNVSATSRGIWKWLRTDVSVNQIPDDGLMKVYPNPSDGDIHLILPNANTSLDISVYDLLGRKVKNFTKIPISTTHEYHLNLRRLDKGVYVLRIKQDNIIRSKKLIIR